MTVEKFRESKHWKIGLCIEVCKIDQDFLMLLQPTFYLKLPLSIGRMPYCILLTVHLANYKTVILELLNNQQMRLPFHWTQSIFFLLLTLPSIKCLISADLRLICNLIINNNPYKIIIANINNYGNDIEWKNQCPGAGCDHQV